MLWGASPKALEIFRQQKEAIRALTHADYRASCRELFKKYGILTIPSIYIYRAVLHVYEDGGRIYPSRETVHNYPTRNRTKKIVPLHRTTRTQATISYMSASFFNCLPDTITQLPPYKFRKVLRDFLINNAFYSIQEFLSFNHDRSYFNV